MGRLERPFPWTTVERSRPSCIPHDGRSRHAAATLPSVIPFSEDPEAAFRAAAHRWLSLLARGEWDAALAMLDEANAYGIVWTREAIVELVDETFSADTAFGKEFGAPRFSEPDAATGSNHGGFGACPDGSFWLDQDVPLCGRFSDLTAQFEFVPRPMGFAMILHDLHVM